MNKKEAIDFVIFMIFFAFLLIVSFAVYSLPKSDKDPLARYSPEFIEKQRIERILNED